MIPNHESFELRRPENSKYRCDTCQGTGRNQALTDKICNDSYGGYICCSSCMGNGLDSAKLFKWSDSKSE